MDYAPQAPVSGPVASLVAQPRRQRRYYRQRIHSLAYISLDGANGGIIRNLGEAGLAVQTVAPLLPNQQVHLRFELLNPRTRVEATGRVAWADSTGQAGLELLDVSQPVRRQLKDWLFTQLLASAYQGSSVESIFLHHKRGEEAQELSFSDTALPAIPLEPQAPLADSASPETPGQRLSLPWYPNPISPRNLPRVVDGLIVLSAVLLFWVVSLAVTHVFPPWPIAIAMALGTAGVFASLYWFLFVYWIRRTPGAHLTRLAFGDSEKTIELEREERFR